MGFPRKAQVDGGLEAEAKWAIAAISLRSLKPINTKARGKENEDDEDDACWTTPTAREARIPEKLTCPPAPRKHRPSRCHYSGAMEFFTPPNLETVFKCHVEKAI